MTLIILSSYNIKVTKVKNLGVNLSEIHVADLSCQNYEKYQLSGVFKGKMLIYSTALEKYSFFVA